MILAITLGGLAIASTSALVYDWFSDKNEKPAVVINTETAYTGASSKIDTKKLLIGVALVGAVFVYFRYIRRK